MTTIAQPKNIQLQSILIDGNVDSQYQIGILMTHAEIERNEWLDK